MNKNIRSSYELYKSKYKIEVDENTYCVLNYLYNKYIFDTVLGGDKIVLPAKMGSISIQGLKQKVSFENDKVKGLAPDWVKTKKLWDNNEEAKASKKLVYHDNSHTEGVRYKYVWSKKNTYTKNKFLYSLRITRANKRAAHKSIMSGKQYHNIK
jgi:hypothetical protein